MPDSLAIDAEARQATTAMQPATSCVRENADGKHRALGQVRMESVVYAVSKRVLDLALAALALVVASPIFALVALAIRLESKGPVVFGQVRLGKHGRPFRCYKFRTMRRHADSELLADPELRRLYEENNFKIPAHLDPRITRLGHFLRKSSLDELPQLFNVIGGSMSLVGPRPIVPEELHWYSDDVDLFLSVKPGITGFWQVHGRNRIGYPERTAVELEGIFQRSFGNDLKLLAKTIPAVIAGRGVR